MILKSMRKAGALIWLWLVVFMLFVSPAAAQVSVAVPPENVVSGPRIILGEIAFIDAQSPAAAALAEALKEIDIGPAPGPGQQLLLRRSQLEQRIMAARLNLSEVSWSLPDELRLTGQGQQLNEAILRDALEKYLASTEPYRSGSFELISANFGNLPSLPPGQAAYRFVPQSSSNPTYLSGNFFFSVDGKEVARARVTAQIDLTVTAVVAARSMSRGSILEDRDLALTQVPYTQAKGALIDPAAAIGTTLKTNISAGEAIKERNLTKSVMVRRGELVTIIAQQGSLKVTASGQAKQDGSLGDTISILNLNSKKTVNGRIIGPNQVEVVF